MKDQLARFTGFQCFLQIAPVAHTSGQSRLCLVLQRLFQEKNCKYSTLKQFQVQINLLYAFRRFGHGNIALDVFFKNAKMTVFCLHILDFFSQNHPKTVGKSLMKKLLWKCQGKNIRISKCNISSREKGLWGFCGREINSAWYLRKICQMSGKVFYLFLTAPIFYVYQ